MNSFDRDVIITRDDMICSKCHKSIVAVSGKEKIIKGEKYMDVVKYKKCKCQHDWIATVTKEEFRNMPRAIARWVKKNKRK